MNDNAQKTISALERENAALAEMKAALRLQNERLTQENRILSQAIERLVANSNK